MDSNIDVRVKNRRLAELICEMAEEESPEKGTVGYAQFWDALRLLVLNHVEQPVAVADAVIMPFDAIDGKLFGDRMMPCGIHAGLVMQSLSIECLRECVEHVAEFNCDLRRYIAMREHKKGNLDAD